MHKAPTPPHQSATPSHYSQDAQHYDSFNEANAKFLNEILEQKLRKHPIKAILDLSCGTGSQVFFLTKYGYNVIGVDINAEMLNIANNKANKEKEDFTFIKGDMRTTQAGSFDAVITMFNAIGHLTIPDFEKTIQNVHKNLKKRGLYLFDIFNLNYLLEGDNITSFTIDRQKTTSKERVREIQYSTIDSNGILTSHTISSTQKNDNLPQVHKTSQTLQVYTPEQLQVMLKKHGFKVLEQCEISDWQFKVGTAARILTVAQKYV